MKKFLISTCAILMISTMANACGGITIKGNSGTSYCLSKHTMNWYSAYAWCHDQGMKLIDLDSVCKSSTSCSELKLSDDEKKHITDNGGTLERVWTNTSVDATHAYPIELSSGKLANYAQNDARLKSACALCF